MKFQIKSLIKDMLVIQIIIIIYQISRSIQRYKDKPNKYINSFSQKVSYQFLDF